LKTAKALGITILQSILSRADELIDVGDAVPINTLLMNRDRVRAPTQRGARHGSDQSIDNLGRSEVMRLVRSAVHSAMRNRDSICKPHRVAACMALDDQSLKPQQNRTVVLTWIHPISERL
jgi:hypothetical protein